MTMTPEKLTAMQDQLDRLKMQAWNQQSNTKSCLSGLMLLSGNYNDRVRVSDGYI